MGSSNSQDLTKLGLPYGAWRGEPLSEVEQAMLALIVKHWRAGTPIEREAANFELVQAGFSFKEVRPSRYELANRRPAALEIQQGDVIAIPRLAALIELGDEKSTADLRRLAHIVEAMRAAYRPDRREITVEQLASAAHVTPAELQRLAPLTDLYRAGPMVPLEEHVMGWTDFAEFLNDRLGPPKTPRVEARGEDAQLPVDFKLWRFSWSNLGPYEEASIELTPLTVLVGTNGAGKTSALMAFEELREILEGEEEPIDGVPLLGPHKQAAEIAFQVSGRLITRDHQELDASWSASLALRPRYAVRRELLHVGDEERVKLELGAGWWRSGGAKEEVTLRPDELAICEANEPHRQPALLAIRQEIARWVIVGADSSLGPPTYHHDILLPSSVKPLEEAAAAVLGPVKLSFDLLRRELVYEDPRGYRQPLDRAPRGVAYVVNLLDHLLQPKPPTLLAIDEIERHLHANALERLIDVLRGFTEHTKIVLTTHSSKVLQSIAAEELRLVRSGEKASSIVNVSRDPRLKRLMETGELGALLDQGYFAEEL